MSTRTYYHDHSESYGNFFFPGSPLNHQRMHHAVGTVIDEVTYKKLIIVTGGYWYDDNFDSVTLNSTEVLLAEKWSLGKALIM